MGYLLVGSPRKRPLGHWEGKETLIIDLFVLKEKPDQNFLILS